MKKLMMKAAAIALFAAIAAPVAQASQYLENLNQRMIRIYRNDGSKRDRGGDNQVPREVRQAFVEINRAGITIFNSINDLASHRNMREVILQEWLRMQDSWGLPWLPLSWSRGDLQHSENFGTLLRQIEGNLSNLSVPMSDDDMLIAYLFVGSIYHTNTESNLVNEVRSLADSLGSSDRTFWDIRVEIHQEPSLHTIQRVQEYINNLPASSTGRRSSAESILRMLNTLFGNGDVESYLREFTPAGSSIAALNSYMQAMNTARSVRSPDELRRASSSILNTLKILSQEAKGVSQWIRNDRFAGCSRDRNVNCRYEAIDLMKQLQQASFALGNVMIERYTSLNVAISVNDAIALIEAFVGSNAAFGMMPLSVLHEVERFKQTVTSNGAVNPVDVVNFIDKIESMVPVINNRIRGMFAPVFGPYKQIVPKADQYVDNLLRSSSLLPLTNLLTALRNTEKLFTGVPLRLGNSDVITPYRVLNPGIAHGKLHIPDAKDIIDEDFIWSPTGIYVLPKTPAALKKVAGILTCDSGSMISHVQLLANNHGLPNVNISCSLLPMLKKMEGQDVLLISLPNGEVQVKLWSEATKGEIAIYNEYNKVKLKERVSLKLPSRLDVNYPVKLEQLRIGHSGMIAGGKAAGQGELAALFPSTVPRAVVLPFGVYFEHMKNAGIYDELKQLFSDPDLKGSSIEAIEKRKAVLAYIRHRVETIEFKPELKAYLIQILMNYPFRGRGVFVRSDTNAEDLPGFVGAGLNLTIPNVVGIENILESVKKVWASPFQEKAFTWRDDLIDNPWDIFPSVVIQIAMPSDKAGVMVVGDTITEDTDDSVILATNEGLGITVVNGEFSPEEIRVSRKENKVNRLRKAYAETKKVLLAKGGISEAPVSGTNMILSDEEAMKLASLGDQFQRHMKETYGVYGKWDIEWAIINGKPILLQVRPFIGNKIARNVSSLKKLERGTPKDKNKILIGLDEPVIELPRNGQ